MPSFDNINGAAEVLSSAPHNNEVPKKGVPTSFAKKICFMARKEKGGFMRAQALFQFNNGNFVADGQPALACLCGKSANFARSKGGRAGASMYASCKNRLCNFSIGDNVRETVCQAIRAGWMFMRIFYCDSGLPMIRVEPSINNASPIPVMRCAFGCKKCPFLPFSQVLALQSDGIVLDDSFMEVLISRGFFPTLIKVAGESPESGECMDIDSALEAIKKVELFKMAKTKKGAAKAKVEAAAAGASEVIEEKKKDVKEKTIKAKKAVAEKEPVAERVKAKKRTTMKEAIAQALSSAKKLEEEEEKIVDSTPELTKLLTDDKVEEPMNTIDAESEPDTSDDSESGEDDDDEEDNE